MPKEKSVAISLGLKKILRRGKVFFGAHTPVLNILVVVHILEFYFSLPAIAFIWPRICSLIARF